MNILVACLGGTIASEVNKDNIVTLKENNFDTSYFKGIMKSADYKVIAPVNYSSENADIATYRKALKGIYDAVAEERPDGILILHGTDSMAYFAQVAVRALSMLKMPVVITGSKKPTTVSGTDARPNLQMALGFLEAGIEGKARNKTFGVVYYDSYMEMSSFVAAQQIIGADIKGDHKPYECERKDYSGSEYIKKAVDFLNKEESDEDKILVIPAVPSFPYGALATEGYGAVLIEGYHSGTANSVELIDFIRKVRENNHSVYLAPSPKPANNGRKATIYESTKLLKDAGVVILPDMPLEGAWAEIAVFK